MLRSVLIIVALGILVAGGIVEGLQSNRWGPSDDLKAAAARLANVPTTVGPWQSIENSMDERQLKVAEAVGHLSRIYTNKSTGASVTVLMLCGPSGPIGAHTPDICYVGSGFHMTGAQGRRLLKMPGEEQASCWTARFEKEGPGEHPIQVYWAWGVDGGWSASDAPRIEFAKRMALYKLYVTRGAASASSDGSPSLATLDSVEEFLTLFLPEVKKVLAPATGTPGA
jgi:hypothetical protein